MTHPTGKYIYTWPQNGSTHMLLCQVTGKRNDVWVEHSLHPVRKQMPRFLFENLIEHLTTQYGAVCSKPTRKARTK